MLPVTYHGKSKDFFTYLIFYSKILKIPTIFNSVTCRIFKDVVCILNPFYIVEEVFIFFIQFPDFSGKSLLTFNKCAVSLQSYKLWSIIFTMGREKYKAGGLRLCSADDSTRQTIKPKLVWWLIIYLFVTLG
jgi:hypothetical protein